MVEKSGDGPKVSITSKGVVSVDAKELFESPNVKKFIEDMAQIEKKSETPQKSSVSANSTN